MRPAPRRRHGDPPAHPEPRTWRQEQHVAAALGLNGREQRRWRRATATPTAVLCSCADALPRQPAHPASSPPIMDGKSILEISLGRTCDRPRQRQAALALSGSNSRPLHRVRRSRAATPSAHTPGQMQSGRPRRRRRQGLESNAWPRNRTTVEDRLVVRLTDRTL
jgi:hypothetical protein